MAKAQLAFCLNIRKWGNKNSDSVAIRDDGCISFINILVSSLSTEKQDYQILHSSNGVIFTHKHERLHAFTPLTVYCFGCFQTVLGAEV